MIVFLLLDWVQNFQRKGKMFIHYNCRDINRVFKNKGRLEREVLCHCYLFVLNYNLIFSNQISTFLQQAEDNHMKYA